MKKKIMFCLLFVFICCSTLQVWAGDTLRFDYGKLDISKGNISYMEDMIPYYIESNVYLKTKLNDGYPGVFLFEGASSNSGEDFYTSRTSAYAVIVQKNKEDEIMVLAEYDDCSTLPDVPRQNVPCQQIVPLQGSVTIKDGVYGLYTCNHTGPYAALNLRKVDPTNIYDDGKSTFEGVYLGTDGFLETSCNGINLHSRRGYAPDLSNQNPRSEGCQLLSFQTEMSGNYNHFMETMAGIRNARFNTFISTEQGQYKGFLVVDRRNYVEQMNELYGDEAAVNSITSFSVQCRRLFEEERQARIALITSSDNYKKLHTEYLMKCDGGLCYNRDITATVTTKKAPIRTLPCQESGSDASIQLECLNYGETLIVTGKIKNPHNNTFYEVKMPDNGVGYVFSGNVRLN